MCDFLAMRPASGTGEVDAAMVNGRAGGTRRRERVGV